MTRFFQRTLAWRFLRKRQASWYFQASGFGNSSRSSVTRKRPYSGLNAVSANLKWQRLLESIYLITSRLKKHRNRSKVWFTLVNLSIQYTLFHLWIYTIYIYIYIIIYQYIGLLTIAMSNLEDPGGKPPPFHLRHFSQNSLKRPPDTIGEGSENMSWTSTRLYNFWNVLKWPFLYQTQSLHTNIT